MSRNRKATDGKTGQALALGKQLGRVMFHCTMTGRCSQKALQGAVHMQTEEWEELCTIWVHCAVAGHRHKICLTS